MKINQFGRSILTKYFLARIVKMRRCFLTTCTKPLHEEKNIKQMCYYGQEKGRSMVEMLGVLAIIGVLSVGSIAGYSVAMRKYKINNFINEQTYLINGLIQHDSLRKLNSTNEQFFIVDYIKKLNLIQQDTKTSSSMIYYNLATIQPYIRSSNYRIDYFLSVNGKDGFDEKICTEVISNLAIPLRESLNHISFYIEGQGTIAQFFGNNECSANKTCLNNITQTQIYDICSSCIKDSYCSIVFVF